MLVVGETYDYTIKRFRRENLPTKITILPCTQEEVKRDFEMFNQNLKDIGLESANFVYNENTTYYKYVADPQIFCDMTLRKDSPTKQGLVMQYFPETSNMYKEIINLNFK